MLSRRNTIGLRHKIENTNQIVQYMHCGKCMDEMPIGVSPKEFQRIQVGWTIQGLQVWCTRHDVNILHIDFEGVQHPANITAKG